MGNQQESDMELSRRCDSGQAMVRRRPAIRTRLEGQTFPPGFSKLWKRRYLALWPD